MYLCQAVLVADILILQVLNVCVVVNINGTELIVLSAMMVRFGVLAHLNVCVQMVWKRANMHVNICSKSITVMVEEYGQILIECVYVLVIHCGMVIFASRICVIMEMEVMVVEYGVSSINLVYVLITTYTIISLWNVYLPE